MHSPFYCFILFFKQKNLNRKFGQKNCILLNRHLFQQKKRRNLIYFKHLISAVLSYFSIDSSGEYFFKAKNFICKTILLEVLRIVKLEILSLNYKTIYGND